LNSCAVIAVIIFVAAELRKPLTDGTFQSLSNAQSKIPNSDELTRTPIGFRTGAKWKERWRKFKV